MARPRSSRSILAWGLPGVLLLLVGGTLEASGPGIGHLFCPVNKRCQEKPPHWHIKRTCPSKPVCDPCSLEHHGYYHTCWRPSSVPPDWSHCPVPPPAVVFNQGQSLPPPSGLLVPAVPLTPPPPVVRPEPGSGSQPAKPAPQTKPTPPLESQAPRQPRVAPSSQTLLPPPFTTDLRPAERR